MLAGALSPYELASALSYFLTDGPPDAVLLQAAAQNMLSTTEQVACAGRPHPGVARRPREPGGRDDRLLRLTDDRDHPIDAPTFPAFNEGVRNSMYRETEEFLKDKLWMGKVGDLLTTRIGKNQHDAGAVLRRAEPARARRSTRTSSPSSCRRSGPGS